MSEFLDVALHVPVDQLFTYSVPKELRGRLVPGMRVLVPFQSRRVGGTCVAVRAEAPMFSVRPILAILEPETLFSTRMLRLARWISRRYGASIGESLDAALPFAIRRGGGLKRIATASLALPRTSIERTVEELEKKYPKQARTLRILAEAEGALEVRELIRRAKVSESPVRTLARHGVLRVENVVQERDPFMGVVVTPDEKKTLTLAQAECVRRLDEAITARRALSFLLLGVTGSGKTEVYLQALATAVEQGRQGIVLVPEIALTPQTVSRFRARFRRVAVLHSNLTDADRHAQWKMIQRGEADIVVGARSAVFAPTPALGVIIIDEEHETTFKQQNAPRYDAREVARARARFEGAVVVLGSATPALETYYRAQRGRIAMLRLPERVGGGVFPESLIADLTQTVSLPGRPRFVSDRLRAAMIERVARGEQVILFLNRRGYATAAICRGCGASISCPNCDIVLVYHRRVGRILCHYCGHEQRLPPHCVQCSGVFRLSGFGTERIEDEVRAFLPEARVARMDSDTMRGRGAHEVVLSAFRDGKIDVLVGTQMIAKGLDMPNVTLVGVVAADTTLNLPDYRAAERTFGLLAQVSGRTGRSGKGGLVIVQTYKPESYAIRLALQHDYDRFAEIELRARRVDCYPPYGHLARIVCQGPEEEGARAAAESMRDHLSEWVADDTTEILGPAPAPIAMINNQHRFHIIVKSRRRSGIRQLVRVVRGLPRPKGRVRFLLDVDPLAML